MDQRAAGTSERSRVRACSSPRERWYWRAPRATAIATRSFSQTIGIRRSSGPWWMPQTTPPKGSKGTKGCRRDTWRDCAWPASYLFQPGTHTHRAYSSRHWRIAPASTGSSLQLPLLLLDDGWRALRYRNRTFATRGLVRPVGGQAWLSADNSSRAGTSAPEWASHGLKRMSWGVGVGASAPRRNRTRKAVRVARALAALARRQSFAGKEP